MSDEGKVISFINMKGGVGKTTLTKEIGYHLATVKNLKVLLVDVDPQINLTQSIFRKFGFAPSESIAHSMEKSEEIDSYRNIKVTKASIQNILNGNISNQNPTSDYTKAIVDIPNTNLSIIPGEFGLDFTNRNLNGGQLENGLYNFIYKNNLKNKFDYILIDCPPTYSSYTISALKPSDYYIIPVRPEAYSILGVNMLEEVIKQIKNENEVYFRDRSLRNLGIILSGVKENDRKGIENLIEDIASSSVLKDNNIEVFKNRFLYNSSLQNNMAYFITDGRAEKISKPNLNDLTNELLSRIQHMEDEKNE
ncbi:ParA family protein [Ligilactobacillus agilis]|uniref:ParA family protein n=1 Tax=Ligilactobacillus agilis TaxID=1601 RepID=A0A9Q9MUL9_9LACO|nr:ParA family protein [Ligilactobacillus agilis]UXC62719.1 ParA family protein [Ligilactobacillus agilis]UXC64719.1 ParA family protein [Ligilactobacillus agilis]